MISEAWPSPDKRMQERNQLITSFISLAVLLYFTFSFMLEAWDTVSKQGGEDESCCDVSTALDAWNQAHHLTEEDPNFVTCHVPSSYCFNVTQTWDCDRDSFSDTESECKAGIGPGNSCDWLGVNPFIVFIFALFGLLFDLGSLWAFRRWGQKFSTLVGGEDSEALNMSSALLHVLSDCLRSTTTLIESILIYFNPCTPSYIFDGWATLIVTISILAGGLSGLYKWARQVQAWRRGGDSALTALTDAQPQSSEQAGPAGTL